MNNLIISGMHYVGIFSLAFFAWTGSVFAAPVVAPVGVSTITETSVTLTGHAYNGVGKTVTIWYEIGEAGSPLMARETRVVHSDSVEQFYPTNLKAGTAYQVRLGAMEGADIVYSSITAFTTKGTPPVVVGSVTNTQATAPAVVSAAPQTASANQQASVTSAKPQTKTVATAKKPATSTQNKTKANTQSAAVIGAGDMFPQTLIGWIVLIILVLIMMLIAHMIIESNDRRKTRRVLHKEEVAE